jgi:hypothetical protein
MSGIEIVFVKLFPDDSYECKAKTEGGEGCLEKNPPSGTEMVYGHQCGLGCAGLGYCAARFVNKEKYPQFFEPPV